MPSPSWPACPDCGSKELEILHEASPDAEATDATLECQACERVFKDVVERPSSTEVDCVISDGDDSWPSTLEVGPEARLRVGDETYGDGHRLLITALEHEDGRRVRSLTPEGLGTVWCKVFDTVDVPVSVNQGHKTWTGDVEATPEEELFVGDELDLKWGRAVIHAIKTEGRVQHEGGARAREIKRLHAKALEGEPIPYDEVHRSERADTP